MAPTASARLRFEPPVCLLGTPGTPVGRIQAIAPLVEGCRSHLIALASPPESGQVTGRPHSSTSSTSASDSGSSNTSDPGAILPPASSPLEGGFVRPVSPDWHWLDRPRQLLDGYNRRRATSHLFAVLKTAHRLRDEIDRVVVVGTAADLAAAQALVGACADPCFNDLDRGGRGSRPRIHFLTDQLDNDTLQALLRLLGEGRPATTLAQRWALVAVLPRHPNLATALAIRHLLAALWQSAGGDPSQVASRFIPLGGPPTDPPAPHPPAPPQSGLSPSVACPAGTAEPPRPPPPDHSPAADPLAIAWEQGWAGNAMQWAARLGCVDAFPANPGEPSGPLTALAAPALLPAALLGIDIVRLLTGAVAFNDQFLTAPLGANPALDFATTALLLAVDSADAHADPPRRPCTLWAQALEQPGRWWETLFAASRRCAFVTHIMADEWRSDPLAAVVGDFPDRTPVSLANRKLPELMLNAADRAIAADRLAGRVTAIVRLPRVDEWSLGQFFQMMMIATTIEQRVLAAWPSTVAAPLTGHSQPAGAAGPTA